MATIVDLIQQKPAEIPLDIDNDQKAQNANAFNKLVLTHFNKTAGHYQVLLRMGTHIESCFPNDEEQMFNLFRKYIKGEIAFVGSINHLFYVMKQSLIFRLDHMEEILNLNVTSDGEKMPIDQIHPKLFINMITRGFSTFHSKKVYIRHPTTDQYISVFGNHTVMIKCQDRSQDINSGWYPDEKGYHVAMDLERMIEVYKTVSIIISSK